MMPSSSTNSRRAVVRASSPAPRSPLGIDQAPSSLLRQKGPAGWTSNTSSLRPSRLYKRMPALSAAIQPRSPPGPASSALTDLVEERPSRRAGTREGPAKDERAARTGGCAIGWVPGGARQPVFERNLLGRPVVVPHRSVQSMKSLPIFAVVIVGLVSACTYRHETVERPVAGPRPWSPHRFRRRAPWSTPIPRLSPRPRPSTPAREHAMKLLLVLACVASSLLVSACMVREERVVQPAPSAAVVAPAPSAVVYTDPAPRTTTTVYTR